MRRLAIFSSLFVCFVASAAPASAVDVEVPVTMDWRIGYHGVATCASWGLATWPEQKGATAWELRYYFSPPNPAYAGERSEKLSPPFDDEEFDQFGWKPAQGTHWDGLSYSGRSSGGGNPVTCTDLQAKQQALYSNVRLIVTLDKCPITPRTRRLQRRLRSARKGEHRTRTGRVRWGKKVARFRRALILRKHRRGGNLTVQEEQTLQNLNRQYQKWKRQEIQHRRQRKKLQKLYKDARTMCESLGT